MKLAVVIVLALCLALLSSFFFFSTQMATQILEGRPSLEFASMIVSTLLTLLLIVLTVYVVVLALMKLPSPP